MRIRVLSDLHLEFCNKSPDEVLRLIPRGKQDVVIIAGDITTSHDDKKGVDHLITVGRHFAEIPVLIVAGNHEYYHGESVDKTDYMLERATHFCNNLVFLNAAHRPSVVIDDIVFIGCTLWFPQKTTTDICKSMLTDYSIIPKLGDWVHERHINSTITLRSEVESLSDHTKFVVITHHLPFDFLISDRFRGDRLNCFFSAGMPNNILPRMPELWVHGHSHDSIDETVADCRFIRNPYGYVSCPNPEFKPELYCDV